MGPDTIPSRYRVALASKASLLLVLMLVFLALTAAVALREGLHWAFKVPLGAFFAVNTAFLAWTTWLGAADALFGQAVTVKGAAPLPSRKSGVSFRLPDGRTAEYLLVNNWAATQPDHRYTLTIGRFSHVIVAEPFDEGATVSSPSGQSPTSP